MKGLFWALIDSVSLSINTPCHNLPALSLCPSIDHLGVCLPRVGAITALGPTANSLGTTVRQTILSVDDNERSELHYTSLTQIVKCINYISLNLLLWFVAESRLQEWVRLA